jgi:hypothetical protein
MILQKQLFEEIKLIPAEKYAEIYDFLHYLRLNLNQEKNNSELKDDSVFKISSQISDDFMSESRNQLPLQTQGNANNIGYETLVNPQDMMLIKNSVKKHKKVLLKLAK